MLGDGLADSMALSVMREIPALSVISTVPIRSDLRSARRRSPNWRRTCRSSGGSESNRQSTFVHSTRQHRGICQILRTASDLALSLLGQGIERQVCGLESEHAWGRDGPQPGNRAQADAKIAISLKEIASQGVLCVVASCRSKLERRKTTVQPTDLCVGGDHPPARLVDVLRVVRANMLSRWTHRSSSSAAIGRGRPAFTSTRA